MAQVHTVMIQGKVSLPAEKNPQCSLPLLKSVRYLSEMSHFSEFIRSPHSEVFHFVIPKFDNSRPTQIVTCGGQVLSHGETTCRYWMYSSKDLSHQFLIKALFYNAKNIINIIYNKYDIILYCRIISRRLLSILFFIYEFITKQSLRYTVFA